jgi:cytochrome P450
MVDPKTQDELVEDFSLARRELFALPQVYERALASGGPSPVRLWNGDVISLVTRYADVRQVLSSHDFSARPNAEGYPILAPTYVALKDERPHLQFLDDPEHQSARRLVAPLFSAPRVERLRPRFAQIVEELYDRMEQTGAPYNFFQDFALMFPSMVICELLGVPFEHVGIIHETTRARVALDSNREDLLASSERANDLMRDLVAQRLEGEPNTDDVIGYVVEKHIKTGVMTTEDAVAVFRVIAQAGHETSANAIALGTYALLTHPDQAAKLREDPGLAASAVEEILRYTNIVHVAVPRAVKSNTSVDGHEFHEGEGVLAAVVAANRDPSVFESPDRFDVERASNPHLTFTTGIHACLGQGVARLELVTVFSTLLQRFPDLRFAVPAEDIVFRTDSKAYGVAELPVAW